MEHHINKAIAKLRLIQAYKPREFCRNFFRFLSKFTNGSVQIVLNVATWKIPKQGVNRHCEMYTLISTLMVLAKCFREL